MFAERESRAVYFLQEQDMTRFDAINYILHGIAKPPGRSETRWVQGAYYSGAGPGQGVLGRGWGIRGGPAAASLDTAGRTGWGMWGPVQYLNLTSPLRPMVWRFSPGK